jgi:hypothetical protein
VDSPAGIEHPKLANVRARNRALAGSFPYYYGVRTGGHQRRAQAAASAPFDYLNLLRCWYPLDGVPIGSENDTTREQKQKEFHRAFLTSPFMS